MAPKWNPCFDAKKRTAYKKPSWEMTREEQMNPPNGVLFDEQDLLEFAEGDIEKVFGPEFAVIDSYERRVRLPAREYLLVSRVTKMNAGVNEFKAGATMSTEYDLPINCELSEGGDVPWAVLVESGQCDLMLISYMGIDFQCKSERVYRLLDTTLIFYGVAQEGQTLVYDIQVNGFAKGSHGGISMFFFSYNCYCDGKLLIEMRGGAAGFFSEEELAAGKGVIKTKAEFEARKKIVKKDVSKFVVATPSKTSFEPEQMAKLVEGEWAQVMDGNAGRDALKYKLCAKKMLMIDRVVNVNKSGGVHGLGLLIGEKFLERDHWYFPCHFVKDQVMAGSLVSDGCSQLLKLYMIFLGLHSKVKNPRFLPIPGNPNKVRCRGQISPQHGRLIYVMEIRDMGIDENGFPFAIADVDIIDVDLEKGQTFEANDLDSYGLGNQEKKIVVDFKGIALRIEGEVVPQAAAAAKTSGVQQGVFLEKTRPPIQGKLISDANVPNKCDWHPLATPQLTPSFYPSVYPPREICFLPFPNNPNDNDHTPGMFPLSWFNITEFMGGKVSKCLGDEFQRFDVSTTSRSPSWDLAMTTRVLSVSNIEPKKIYNIDVNPSKGSMVAEFDCPSDAWFFKGSSNDGHMPYSILMEIGLQTSGILTSVLKAPLTMDKDNILFRNLDATAECVREMPDLRNKTIVNSTTCTGYSMLGDMGIHRFKFELSVDGEAFYTGDTSFGWFIPEVFEKQVGLDSGVKREPWHLVEGKGCTRGTKYSLSQLKDRKKLFGRLSTANHKLGRRSEQCEYLDTIEIFDNSGKFDSGYAHGHKTVDKNDWFFSCHFWMDPVMPGSLGIESMVQSMEAFVVHTDVPGKFGLEKCVFDHSVGKTSWKYRGQMTPKATEMDEEVHIKSVKLLRENVVEIVADGFLYVDKLRVYSATNLRLLVKGALVSKAKTVGDVDLADANALRTSLLDLDAPLRVAENFTVHPCLPNQHLGDRSFCDFYGVDYPMYTGAMAKGIASADMVIACGKRKILASFGAGGLPLQVTTAALDKIQAELPNGPFAVNLIHSPFDSNLERGNVDLFLKRNVTVVEASAFMNLTPEVVRYRACGLSKSASGEIVAKNRIIGKVSRTELAEMFINPAPKAILDKLVAKGDITQEQASLAASVPVCDDIAVEADSGGHTDNRPIHVILPLICAVRDRICADKNYYVRVGAGGGIGCPQAAHAAYAMGASFIITGTVNQMAKQSGTSDIVRKQLSEASYADITMAPAADMFDQGVELQVLKKGTMFPARAKKLYEYFVKYDSLEDIPEKEMANLEKRVFRQPLAKVWRETRDFYINVLHNQDKVDRGEVDGKLKMSLVFRWYLGQSSAWANRGVTERSMDYQVWCGPAIGSFNDFIENTYLDPKKSGEFPCVAQINLQLMRGAAYYHRLEQIKASANRLGCSLVLREVAAYSADFEL